MSRLALSGITILALASFAVFGVPSRPCEEPLAYRIGFLDERFDLEPGEVMDALLRAEAVWEEASGRDLFAFSSDEDALPISFIYDYRQEATEELGELEREVAADESSYRALERKLKGMKAEYEAQAALFEARASAFNERRSAYEEKVEKWNRGPRDSREEFESLEAERLAINAEADALKEAERSLNQLAGEVNRTVDSFNAAARALNLAVEEYNRIGSERGETFEGGMYYEDRSGEGIHIYEFSGQDALVRVLAHELGHALGLDHAEANSALMHEKNDSDALEATAADIALLESLCAKER